MRYRSWLDPKDSLVPAAMAVVAMLVLLVLALGCNYEPTGPKGPCGPCGAMNPPPQAMVDQAIRLGYEQAKATCQTLPPWEETMPPKVQWEACDFMTSGGCCASGATYYASGKIAVSLADPGNVLPLVTWESRNWYWGLYGCRDQAV